MDFPLTLLGLAGAVALLLWGVHMVQTGVQRAFGPNLRRLKRGLPFQEAERSAMPAPGSPRSPIEER